MKIELPEGVVKNIARNWSRSGNDEAADNIIIDACRAAFNAMPKPVTVKGREVIGSQPGMITPVGGGKIISDVDILEDLDALGVFQCRAKVSQLLALLRPPALTVNGKPVVLGASKQFPVNLVGSSGHVTHFDWLRITPDEQQRLLAALED